MKVMNQILL